MSSHKKIDLWKDSAAGDSHSVMLVFSTKLCDLYSLLLPLSSSLWFNSPPPLPLPSVNKYCILFIRIQCVRGGGGIGFCWRPYSTEVFVFYTLYCIWPDSEPTKLLDYPKQKPRRELGIRQINTCLKGPLLINCYRWQHFALLSMSLIFLRYTRRKLAIMLTGNFSDFLCFLKYERRFICIWLLVSSDGQFLYIEKISYTLHNFTIDVIVFDSITIFVNAEGEYWLE